MKINVNLVSGDICTFDLPIDNPMEFLNKIRPTEIFKRAVHQFIGKLRTVSINPEFVEWIEFDTDIFPKNNPLAMSVTIRQLSQESFNHWINKEKESIKAVMEQDLKQNVLLAFAKGTFRSGRSMQFEIRAEMKSVDDRAKLAQKIFNMPAIFIYGEASGIFMLNTKNIVIWQVVPGLKKPTAFAVSGELVSVQREKAR